MASLIGQTVSHYRILEQLGSGGMGVVYKARDTRLDRTVALKFLPPSLTADPDAKQRFIHEAKAASALQHNNICTVHDIDQTDHGELFIVMDHYGGETLKEKIERGPMSIDEALEIATQIAQGLARAHEQGITHRDVKPANVIVTPDGTAKIVDFGLAKLSGASRLTRTGSTLGTMAYMSPEQLQGDRADARGDIFSFGVMLYEMLTGRAPFHAEHEAALAYSIINAEPEPLLTYLPAAPSELIHIVGRTLEKDPRDRYQTMSDVLIDLRRLGRETGRVSKTSPGIPGTRRKRLFRGAAAALLIVIASLSVYLFLVRRAAPTLNPAASPRRLDIPFSQVGAVSLSKDGSWVAFMSPDAKNVWSVYYMNVARGGKALRLATTPFQYPGFTDISPDGSEVLYGGYRDTCFECFVVSSIAAGEEGRRVLEGSIFGARWRPDGRRIGYLKWNWGPSTPEFWTANPDGSNPLLEFSDSLRAGGMTAPLFDWSPDGKAIAMSRGTGGDTSEIVIRDLASGRERELTHLGSSIEDLAWGSNGLIFFSSNRSNNYNIWALPAEGGDLLQVSKGSGPDLDVQVSSDAQRVLYTEREDTDNLWTTDLDGSNARQLTFEYQRLFTPVFSPDGRRICFQSWPGQLNRRNEIVVINADGSNRRRITPEGIFSFQPSWSPDGKTISYAWRRRNESFNQVSLVDVANPASQRHAGKGMGAWWIDADRLAVNRVDPPKTVVLSASDFRVLQSFEDSTWQFPLRDGRYVLIEDFRVGREGWWLLSSAGARGNAREKLLGAGYLTRAWPSVSRNFLLYLETDGGVWRISLPRLKRERFPELLDGSNPHWFEGFQLSPDDRQIVFKKTRFEAKVMLYDNLFE